MKNIIKFKLLSKNATLPQRATNESAGLDLFAAENRILKSFDNTIIKTDIQCEIPIGFYGRVASRSGLALRHKIMIMGGVIDSDYRGNIMIILYNLSKEDFEIKIGDKIAQLIIEQISYPDIEIVNDLNETSRGDKGFGSSDNKNDDDDNGLLSLINYYIKNNDNKKIIFE